MKSRTFTCFGDWTSDNSVSQTDKFVNVNVFNSVTSRRVLDLLPLRFAVGFNFNLTFGLQPQVVGIKIVTV